MLQTPFRYRAIQDYLISDLKWQVHKQALLDKAGLSEFTDVDKVLSDYKDKLASLYDKEPSSSA